MLSPEELERYARHIVLREVGGPGQAALKRARVLVIGAGGLGAPVLMYLAAAGVGTLGVIDDDAVSLSNLQRQIIHATDDVGAPKVDERRARDRAAQPACRGRGACDAADRRERARSGVGATTSSPTARTISPPVIWCPMRASSPKQAAGDGDARHLRRHADHHPGARARARRQAQPDLPLPVSGGAAAGRDPACAEAGILGALTGVLGSMMALEVIREIVGFGKGLVGRYLMVDARDHALRDAELRVGPGQSALGREADDPRSVDPRVSYLLHTATVVAPFTTDHLFFSILTSV